ncbi:hypothetical protein HNR46_001409 [Haloferula luteola]|uniref:DUF3142 domain-containing protein n=1 Tax=Haloferula luteola TaxID=595692 RepID=A0A840UZK1_9BACT|nr:DUF3142 domain-containing protein [Haloferula luteola]MBB5351175.1 hypothetical protein [Haloferula luteola]
MGRLLLILLARTTVAVAAGWDTSFWVWNHPQPLSSSDRSELTSCGQPTLYWQAAEVTRRSGWQDRRPPTTPGDSSIPVIRFEPALEMLDHPRGIAALPSFWETAPPCIQIDFDCPASRLADYAAALRRLRQQLGTTRLSITALASWIESPDFRELAEAVDELVPMFYDLHPDPPAAVRAGRFEPMVSQKTLRWIRRWKSCPRPWRAGLPNFQRLTLFHPDGTLSGHLPSFQPAWLDSHPGLRLADPTPARYEITSSTSLARRALIPGEILLWRQPDESLARQAAETARRAGAAGVLWFAHPASAPTPWRSVSHLVHLAESPRPKLELTLLPQGRIRLSNGGKGDLPLRTGAQPWTLTLTSQPGDFAELQTGDFSSLGESDASLLHPEFSATISLRFHQLPASQSLTTGEGFFTANTPPSWNLAPAP